MQPDEGGTKFLTYAQFLQGKEAVQWANMKRVKKEWAKVLLVGKGDFHLDTSSEETAAPPTDTYDEAPSVLGSNESGDESDAEAFGRGMLPVHWR